MLRIATFVLFCVFSCQGNKGIKDEKVNQQFNISESWSARILDTGEILLVNEGDIYLIPLADPPGVFPTLIGGRVADPKDFPATVYSSQGNSRCTSTVIGPRTLLTAAHCVGNGRTAAFKAGGVDYTSTCTHHSDYARNSTADWALCYVAQDVAGITYESVNIDPSLVKVGTELLLSGYGCINPGGGGGNDGIYRIGEAKVQQVPSGTNYDIVTKGGAALCFGDSGGPAYLINGQSRVMVSVNSRGDIATTSYLVSLSSEAFRNFSTSWAAGKSTLICGKDSDAPNCRGKDPGPQYPPISEHCKPDLEKLNLCLYGNPRHAVAEPKVCEEKFAQLFACVVEAQRKE